MFSLFSYQEYLIINTLRVLYVIPFQVNPRLDQILTGQWDHGLTETRVDQFFQPMNAIDVPNGQFESATGCRKQQNELCFGRGLFIDVNWNGLMMMTNATTSIGDIALVLFEYTKSGSHHHVTWLLTCSKKCMTNKCRYLTLKSVGQCPIRLFFTLFTLKIFTQHWLDMNTVLKIHTTLSVLTVFNNANYFVHKILM